MLCTRRSSSDRAFDRASGETSAYSLPGANPFPGAKERTAMSHRPPKEEKKKPAMTPKEKKVVKQQKKHAGDAVPLIKH